jgi:hypothetical protein
MKFYFQGKGYRQIDGIAMGSPLSPILADIFMGNIEKRAHHIIDRAFLYRRYVDDILLITECPQDASLTFTEFNGLHPNIKVTMESEENNSISFLDLRIRRRIDGSIQRSVHRKCTWSGQYLHFQSFVPIQYKRGLVRTLFHRARSICSEDELKAEIETLYKTLEENGYPRGFINKHSKPANTVQEISTVPKLDAYLKLPFRGDEVDRLIKHRLCGAVKSVYNAVKPVILYRTVRIPLPSIKQPISLFAKSHIIYEYKCGCSETYIGRSERQLGVRVAEHIPKWVMEKVNDSQDNSTVSGLHNQSGSRTPASSIARHLIALHHPVDREKSFKIIYSTRNKRTLHFAEAVAIRKFKPILCVQKDLFISLALPW